MSKRKTVQVLRTNLGEHPASHCWMTLSGTRSVPREIHVLKRTKKTEVYRLCGVGPGQRHVVAKRRKCEALALEAAVYRDILVHLPISRLRCYGHLDEADGPHGWLFLEDAGGESYRPDDAEHRALAARWLAHMHGTAAKVAAARRLLRARGTDWYLERLRATRLAIIAHPSNPVLTGDDRRILGSIAGQLDDLEGRWNEVEARCAPAPSTLAHADFVPKNTTVRLGPNGAELLSFDWEYAGWGPPAVDLQYIDAALYWDVYRRYEPKITLAQMRDAAEAGLLLRLILSISWAALSLLQYRSERDTLRLGVYKLRLEKSLGPRARAERPLRLSGNEPAEHADEGAKSSRRTRAPSQLEPRSMFSDGDQF